MATQGAREIPHPQGSPELASAGSDIISSRRSPALNELVERWRSLSKRPNAGTPNHSGRTGPREVGDVVCVSSHDAGGNGVPRAWHGIPASDRYGRITVLGTVSSLALPEQPVELFARVSRGSQSTESSTDVTTTVSSRGQPSRAGRSTDTGSHLGVSTVGNGNDSIGESPPTRLPGAQQGNRGFLIQPAASGPCLTTLAGSSEDEAANVPRVSSSSAPVTSGMTGQEFGFLRDFVARFKKAKGLGPPRFLAHAFQGMPRRQASEDAGQAGSPMRGANAGDPSARPDLLPFSLTAQTPTEQLLALDLRRTLSHESELALSIEPATTIATPPGGSAILSSAPEPVVRGGPNGASVADSRRPEEDSRSLMTVDTRTATWMAAVASDPGRRSSNETDSEAKEVLA